MQILKWYSIILVLLSVILNIIKILTEDNKTDRVARFFSVLVFVPIFIFLINK